MDLVLDFTHTYSADWIEENEGLKLINCSDIEGTDMYCAREAEEELGRRLSGFPLNGIHFIDSGNYHYMTRFFTKRLSEPYNLVLFDNHNDMQPTMIPELLSCGSWAKGMIETDENLQKLVLIGPSEKVINDIKIINADKLVCVSREEMRGWSLKEKLAERLADVDMSLPLYVSVDKDVMSEEYARTNWNQGEMSLGTLKDILEYIFNVLKDKGGAVIAVDICGELPHKDAPFKEAIKAEKINRRTNQDLYVTVHSMLENCKG